MSHKNWRKLVLPLRGEWNSDVNSKVLEMNSLGSEATKILLHCNKFQSGLSLALNPQETEIAYMNGQLFKTVEGVERNSQIAKNINVRC